MNFTLSKSNLNFKVYTVAAKPTAPGADNDIAIISSVPMSNWIMSPEKPSGIPRTDGDVWIQYSTKGDTFNALKQNALMIATINAWQYVDGAWVDRDAISCQGGEWVDWVEVYLINGDNFRPQAAYGGTAVGGTYSFSEDGYYGKISGKQEATVVSKQKADLTNIRQITAPYSVNITAGDLDVNGRFFLGVATGNSGLGDGATPAIVRHQIKTTSAGTLTIDTSELTGEYYIWVLLASWNTAVKAEATVGNLSFYK